MNRLELPQEYLSQIPRQTDIGESHSMTEPQNHYGEAKLDTGTVIGLGGVAVGLTILVIAKLNEWRIKYDWGNHSDPTENKPDNLRIVEEE